MAHNDDVRVTADSTAQHMEHADPGLPGYTIFDVPFLASDYSNTVSSTNNRHTGYGSDLFLAKDFSNAYTNSYMPSLAEDEYAMRLGLTEPGFTAPSLFHNNTYPLSQPTFHCNEGASGDNRAPPRLSTQGLNQYSSPEHEPIALSSFPSRLPIRHCRSHSVPETQAFARHRYLTPDPPPRPAPSSTPRRRPISSNTPDKGALPSRTRSYAAIAPNLPGLSHSEALKRLCGEDDLEWPSAKRNKSIPLSPTIEIGEEESLLLRLKDEENLSWKEIQARFSEDMNKTYQVPALQMRFKRLRERMRVWTEGDIQALKLAHDYWLQSKFDIIASKMSEFGSTEKWNGKQISRKWQEISWTSDFSFGASQVMMRTPASTYTASPIEPQPYPNALGLCMNSSIPITAP